SARLLAESVDANASRAAAGELQGVTLVRNANYLDFSRHLIQNAKKWVFAQLFFFQVEGQNSPGRQLLDDLAVAWGRGVDVRLILDTDLPEDFHGASSLNANALAALQVAGVPYRLDMSGVTSHCRTLQVDDDQLLLGSHNWTPNSLYLMEEASLYIEGTGLAGKECARFLQLWDWYNPDPQQRTIAFNLLRFLQPAEHRRLAAEGYSASRELLNATGRAQQVRSLARRLRVDPPRLERFWRMLRLMHAFAFPEATAYALTLTAIDSPSDFRRTPRTETLAALRALPELEPPYDSQPIRFDVVEATHV
ncbi:MAG: hypothetical protein EHM70_14660, partial [Chloroflexota bacterium]